MNDTEVVQAAKLYHFQRLLKLKSDELLGMANRSAISTSEVEFSKLLFMAERLTYTSRTAGAQKGWWAVPTLQGNRI